MGLLFSRFLNRVRWPVVGAVIGAAIAGDALAQLVPLEDRLDIVAGRPAVVPLSGGDGARPQTTPTVRLQDGREVPATLYRLEAAPAPVAEQDPVVRSWLGPAMRWRVRTAADIASLGSSAAAWALLIDLPADATGTELVIAGAPIDVNWLEAQALLGELPLRETPRTPEELDLWIDALLTDPLERWRAVLLTDRLARGGAGDADEPATATDRHPVLDALARQEEDRWNAALHRLARVDAQLCAEFSSALTDVIDFGAGRIAPAWSPADADLLRLRLELLDPRQNGEELAHRVRLWLASRPGLTTWVIDDAGAVDARGAPIVALGVAERRGRAEMAGMRLPGLGLPEESRRTPLPPHGRIVMVRAVDAGAGPVEIEVAAGDRRSRSLVLCNPVEVTPPGLVIGPLLRDWRMVDWDAGAPSPAVGDRATAALLQRGLQRGDWELYIECRTPVAAEDETAPSTDHVRLWLGTTIDPAARLRITDQGIMIDELRPNAEQTRLRVQREPDRWSVVVPIPAEAIGTDGALRLALQRVDARGTRSTWPRALMPWRETPGRIAVDLTTWREVGAGD